MTPLGRAALKLAQRGLRVFPCIERTKKPIFKDNLRLATTIEDFVRTWWRDRHLNIGIATGPGSGIWVLDLDGHEHEAWLREKEIEHGEPVRPTVEVITARGRHLWFAWPGDGREIRNIQYQPDFPDVRGEGGYVLAPPSIHPSGRAYAWSVDSADEFADAPLWLIDLIIKRNNRSGRSKDVSDDDDGDDAIPEPQPSATWQGLLDADHEGSHRGGAIAKLSGLLLRRYVDPYATLGIAYLLNERRCCPPLARREVLRIVDDIAGREAERRDREEAAHG